MFKFRKSLPMGYNRQGYIYFTSRMYKNLPREQKATIRMCCEEAGGEYKDALFDFVTSDKSATQICLKHSISESTLMRIVRKYYVCFPTE